MATSASKGLTLRDSPFFVPLSSSSKHHLLAVQAAFVAIENTVSGEVSNDVQSVQISKPAGKQEVTLPQWNDLTSFTVFPRLPAELQANIWKLWIISRSQTVRIASNGNGCNTEPRYSALDLAELFFPGTIKRKALKSLGYVVLTIVSGEYPNRYYLFNPLHDILYITRNYTMDSLKLQQQLKECNALDKLRCITVHRGCPDFASLLASLHHYPALEVIFVVISWYTTKCDTEWTGENEFCFKHVSGTLGHDHLYGAYHTIENQQKFQQELQLKVAAKRHGPSPRVILVGELDKTGNL